MKKFFSSIGIALLCTCINAQVYVFSSQGMVAEMEENPDSIIIKPLYRTPLPAQNTGALSGVFSVSRDRKVRFSKGNLQYRITDGVWQFAEHQYDTVGGNISNPIIDQFGFGTSGWAESGTVAYHPTDVSTVAADYDAYYADANLTTMSGYMEKRDWGIYNPIVNGGNQAGLWRTLTGTEWGYVLTKRWTPYAIAIVNGVWGVVVLPDGWDEPETLKLRPCSYDKDWKKHTALTEEEISAILAQCNNDTLSYNAKMLGLIVPFYTVIPGYKGLSLEQRYDDWDSYGEWDTEHTLDDYNITPAEWSVYEAKGCVFLPFNMSRSCDRNTTKDNYWDYYCMYHAVEFPGRVWNFGYTGSANSPLKFQTYPSSSFYAYPYIGGCVRLVQDY